MDIPAPGQAGDDRAVRWHVRRSELARAGAGNDALDHLDALVDALDPRGDTVLVTADDTDATFCWLIDRTVHHLTQVGPHPALIAALDELSDRAPVIVAVVDHLGADLFVLEHVQTHRHTGGDRSGYQRRAEAVYERNADTVAAQITEHAVHAAARLIVLTGDGRETAAVADHLDTHRFTVVTVHAGTRNDPRLAERLREAAIEQSLAHRADRRSVAIAHLREELGRHALAVEGQDATTSAITDGRVATLFVDRIAIPDGADTLAYDTLLRGGTVVVADDLGVADSVAAILRYATH
jgi:stalled ribosome rescue protein Dom34